MKYRLYGMYVVTRYLGTVEAADTKEAVRQADHMDEQSETLCWQCNERFGDDPHCTQITAEPASDSDPIEWAIGCEPEEDDIFDDGEED